MIDFGNDEPYGWYNSTAKIAATETGGVEKSDYRMPSVAHGNIVCQCAAHIKLNDFEQVGCKWYVKSLNRTCCMYDRFEGMMCDKIVIDGKEIN